MVGGERRWEVTHPASIASHFVPAIAPPSRACRGFPARGAPANGQKWAMIWSDFAGVSGIGGPRGRSGLEPPRRRTPAPGYGRRGGAVANGSARYFSATEGAPASGPKRRAWRGRSSRAAAGSARDGAGLSRGRPLTPEGRRRLGGRRKGWRVRSTPRQTGKCAGRHVGDGVGV